MNYQTLTELHARAIVHGDAFKLWQRHAAEKAVTRLRQRAADTGAQPETAVDVLAWHETLRGSLGRSTADDEAGMLRRLLCRPTLPVAVAERIVRGQATLEDALVALDHRDDLAPDRERLRNTVERFVAKSTNLVVGGPAQIPARRGAIDARLKKLSHADFKLAASSWPSFCSRVRQVAAIVDCTHGRSLKRSQLSGAWADLVATIDRAAGGHKKRDQRTKKERTVSSYLSKLWPLVAFCARRDIDPSVVSDQTIATFLADSDPTRQAECFQTVQSAIYAWEALQDLVPGFPEQRLARIYGNGRAVGLAFEDLPQSLQDDWAAFVSRNASMPTEDLTAFVADDGGSAPLRQKVRRVTATIPANRLVSLKSTVTLAANAVIASGGSPACLADLVTPLAAERTVEAALLRQRLENPSAPPKHSYLKALAGNLLKIARLIGVTAHDERLLVELRDDFDPYLLRIETDKETGKEKRIFDEERMGPRHLKRLEQFNDPVKLHEWFQMMPKLFRRMQDSVRDGKGPNAEQVNDAIACVLHAITQSCPVRRENLAMITITGHEPWLRMPVFEGDRARLTVPAQYVKNKKQVDGELTPEAADIVRFFIKHFRPVLMKAVGASASNPYLFPAGGMKHRTGQQLNDIFVRRNWKFGGLVLNIHCQRHVCAKLILDDDPTQMELVRILLDHKSIKTTERFYTRINKIVALRQFHDLVAKRRQELLELMNERKRYSAPRRKDGRRTGK